MIEELFGKEKLLFNIFISLKKSFITMSWVTNIAKKPKRGLIVQILVDSFFNLRKLYINNL